MSFQSVYFAGTLSSSSLDLCQRFPFAESQTVISESLTLDSLTESTTSTNDIPPFPPGHAPPIATAITLGNRLPLSLRKFEEFSPLDDPATVFITSPTAPRLKTMLRESLCLRRWAEGIPPVGAPGHVPWADVEDTLPTCWIPEGSSFPPEEFRKALLNKRYSPPRDSWNVDSPPVSSEHSDATTQTSCRNTLVFEREITLNTGGQSRRLSFQVPAVSMNPEMVDLMLELKGLNLFFQGESGDANPSVESYDKGTKCTLIPPALVVSNSECSVPILLDSLGDSPLALAVRRGKRIPPPLSLRREAEQDPYSGIPTAFLGSPSTYSPKFEFANLHDGPSMGLEDMVANLRSHCLSFMDSSPVISGLPGQRKSIGQSICDQAQLPVDDEDEWTFANSLLETYGDLVRIDGHFLPEGFNSVPLALPSQSLVQNSSTDVDSESTTDTSDQSPDTSVESVDLCHNRSSIQHQPCLKPVISVPCCPPSGPLPLRPALTSPTSPKFTRGILKRCKSVRFASLPSRHVVPPCSTKPPLPRRSTGASIVTPRLRRPSPLRNDVSGTSRPCTTPTISRAASVISADPGKKSLSTQGPVTRGSAIRPTSTVTPGKRLTNTFPFRRPATKQAAVSGEKQSSQTTSVPSLGRHSLGRLIRATPAGGKENKAAGSFPNASRWSTLDENMLRRGSASDLPGSRMNKSRMPVPLRNIFDRFK